MFVALRWALANVFLSRKAKMDSDSDQINDTVVSLIYWTVILFYFIIPTDR